jgi:hypothetical protein
MAVGLPLKTTYANGDVFSASDINDTNGTINITAAPFAAGKNKIINGDFGVWQRGTSFTPAFDAYTADRWQEDATTAYPTSQTISQQSFTPGTAPVAGYEGRFFLRFAYTYAPGNGGSFITQKIENVQTFAGQTITVSFWAKAGAAINMDNATLRQNFGSGGSTTVQTTVGAASLTTSWQRFSFTVAVPSISGKTIGTNSFLELRIFMPATSSTTDIWGVQVEAGSVATAFQTATGTIQGELAACQRYYYRLTALANNAAIGLGFATSTTNSRQFTSLPVEMRVTPTSIEYSTLEIGDNANPAIDVTTATLNVASNTRVGVLSVDVASGATQYRPYALRLKTASTSFLGFSAEL